MTRCVAGDNSTGANVTRSKSLAARAAATCQPDRRNADTRRIKGARHATTVFSDPNAIDAPDLVEPRRFVIIGVSQLSRVLFVVFAERDAARIASSAPERQARRNGESTMKKPRNLPETSLERYDWTKATRGRFAKRFPRDAHAVVIDPALWPNFGSARAVNEALRAAVAVASTVRTKNKKTRAA